MKKLLILILLLFLGVGAASASTILHTYSSESAFLSAVLPGYYMETFSSITAGPSLGYSRNGYSYTISARYGLQTLLSGRLEEVWPGDTITIGFANGGVTALGGNFFALNALAQPKGTTIRLNFAGGPTQTITSTTSTSTFTGYTFSSPLTSMTISAQSSILSPRYATLDNLVVGTAIPEPGSWILLGAGLGLLGIAKFRRR